IGKEDALADDLGNRVEMAVDGLEAQGRHAHRVGIGIDEGYRGPPAPTLADRPLLAGEELLCFALQGPGHTVRVSPSPSPHRWAATARPASRSRTLPPRPRRPGRPCRLQASPPRGHAARWRGTSRHARAAPRRWRGPAR